MSMVYRKAYQFKAEGRPVKDIICYHKSKTMKRKPLWTQMSKEFTCNAGDPGLILGQEDPLEEERATHCSILGQLSCSNSIDRGA